MDDDYKDPKSYRNVDVTTRKGRNKDTIRTIAIVVAAGVAIPILAFLLSWNAPDRDEAAIPDVRPVVIASD